MCIFLIKRQPDFGQGLSGGFDFGVRPRSGLNDCPLLSSFLEYGFCLVHLPVCLYYVGSMLQMLKLILI